MVAATAEGKRTRTPKSTVPKNPRGPQSEGHKAKIAEGRKIARTVAEYLDGLAATKPKRGRQVPKEKLQERLVAVEAELPSASPIDRLNLLQEQKDLTAKLEDVAPEVDMKTLEQQFIAVAKEYAEKKHIARATFVEVGVPVDVLKAAGI